MYKGIITGKPNCICQNREGYDWTTCLRPESVVVNNTADAYKVREE